jgi:hypothetical protein
MKRLTVVAALATVAALGLSRASLAAEAPAAEPVVVVAVEPASEAEAAGVSVAEPTPSFFEASADPTCEDFGFFAADKKAECDKACKKGNKCQRKQVCGDGQCPPPGYCWKCPN